MLKKWNVMSNVRPDPVIFVASLGECSYDSGKEHAKAKREGSSSPQGGIKLASSSPGKLPVNQHEQGLPEDASQEGAKTPFYNGNGKHPSYSQVLPLAAEAAQ